MYIPKIYRIEDRSVIEDFIRENGFATIISSLTPYPLATHIPLDLQTGEGGDAVLWGHVSKGNPQWKQFESNPNVLAVFLSHIHSYISSSWYSEPEVPTWNYMSVQVTGSVEILTGEKLRESVRRLTDKYEKKMENPVSLDALPPSVQRQMNGIVGFEVKIDTMECAFKLSQNRNRKDLANIIDHLKLSSQSRDQLMAEVMAEQVLPDG